jgi:hypothetical protein
MDIARSFTIKSSMNEAKFDALSNTMRALSLPTQNARHWTM